MPGAALPDPAVVVLVGASGAGKSTWARDRYRAAEIVSSDDLRGVVGSGRHDLDASVDAFALLDTIVAARLRRGLTTVIDTLGLDPVRRRGYLDQARANGLPAVVVVLDAAPSLARERNAQRDRPVPARVLGAQLARLPDARAEIAGEGWDAVLHLESWPRSGAEPGESRRSEAKTGIDQLGTARELDVVLQISRFPWGEDPAAWLRDIALAAGEAGFAGIALLDHLIQIPQVGRVWEPMPEPWVTLGLLAGLLADRGSGLRLGTLVTPVTFRPPGVIAKAAATLDALTGGRAFLGLGAGWWEREHAAYGIPFPTASRRLDQVEAAIETIRALWSPGTKAFAGERVSLPETTCYPRPVGEVPIILGGSGSRTLRIAAGLADACNLSSADDRLDARIAELRSHCERAGRDPADVAVTVLDIPVVGQDRDEVWARVEQQRGRTRAAAYAATHHAGTYVEQRTRYADLAARGVSTVFVALGHLRGAEDVLAAAPMLP